MRYSASNVSPLVLDLGCDGVSITSIETGVYFDIQNNGFVHKVGWIDVNEGLLALDANHNGVIDDVSELFGDDKIAAFTKLAPFDSNEDGKIDRKDARFAELLVWRDAQIELEARFRVFEKMSL